VRAFSCPRCGQLVFFENFECLRCHAALGFDPERRAMVLVNGDDPGGDGRCANQFRAACNWVLRDPGQPGSGPLCRSCRLTRTRPNDADLAGDAPVGRRFVRAEAAKRRLVFQLQDLGLPLASHHEHPGCGLAFDLLARDAAPITIGHADGVITIDLAESDDAYRERMRAQLGEPYRTMLGHLRHEVGHYYWDVLISAEPQLLAGFRTLFGDERADYQHALERHYGAGPPPGWAEGHVSAYAAAHPWEDWAETWAHFLHIADTRQTAAAHGVIVTGPRFPPRDTGLPLEPSLIAAPSVHDDEDFDGILGDWLPLVYALNAINRSMGKDDLYPFVLSPTVIEKLRFVHHRVLHPAS
jgi:hypothetical protein